MDPKNIRLYGGNDAYFIEDQYKKDAYFDCKDTIFVCKDAIFDCKDTNFHCKDTIFDYEDAYYYYDIDVDRILLFKQSENEYFIRYKHSNKMDIVPLQLKIKNLYNEIENHKIGDVIFIKDSDEEFFEKMREIWNKINELINIDDASNFVKNTLVDNIKYIEADILKNTNFIKSSCLKDKIIIVLDSVFNDILIASLLEIRKYEY